MWMHLIISYTVCQKNICRERTNFEYIKIGLFSATVWIALCNYNREMYCMYVYICTMGLLIKNSLICLYSAYVKTKCNMKLKLQILFWKMFSVECTTFSFTTHWISTKFLVVCFILVHLYSYQISFFDELLRIFNI